MKRSLSDAERDASRWIARLEAHDVTLRDHQRFRAWLARSPENRLAYEGLARTWDKLDALRFITPNADTPSQPQSRRWLLLGGAAAAAAVTGVAIFSSIEAASATPYATRVGERKSVTFADGSTAELNADSALRVSISAAKRRVRLIQGEVLFTVRPDAERPFVVETSFGELRVHGTTFLVKLGVASARATVFQGVVEGVRDGGFFSAPASASAAANQELVLDRTRIAQTAVAPQALAHRLSWREGMLAFDGDTLADAALEIERQTGVRFQFADPEIAAMRVGGYISAVDVDAFIELVETDLHLHAQRQSPSAILISR